MTDILALECPPLHHLPKTNTTHTTPDIILNTEQRIVGTTVTASCPENYHVVGQEVVTCLKSGKWNVEELPHCSDVFYGVPDSTKIYIAVFAVCAAICVMVFTVIIAKIICYRDRHGYTHRDKLGRSTESVSSSSLAYIADESKQPPPPHVPIAVILDSQQDPENNLELYVNEAFHNEDQEKWRQRLSSYDSSFDGEYDHNWRENPEGGSEHNRKWSSENESEHSRKWSSHSVGGIQTYDYDRYGRLPHILSGETLEDEQTPF